MSKQTGSEILMSQFRKNINDGDIYVLSKKNGEIVSIDKVAYLNGAEYVELANVANANKLKYDTIAKEKHDQEQKKLDDELLALKSIIKENHDKIMSINKKLLQLIKVIYGTEDGDLDVLLPILESEVNK